ncbi:DUF2247 family protein [Nocardia farcinica]|uniref:DUF2247 family protein n=1 Tax=Nocardia farcinica TaxID=37329 RepID=UPI00311E6146
MSDPIEHTAKFRIPASFIVDWARVTPRELHYGYTNQWISSADVVELALGSIVPSGSKMGIVEEISLLLSDELDRIPELMDQLIDRDDRVWTYLALAWVHENQEEFDDPLKTVDLIFADFGYPQDVGEFVTFMPPYLSDVPPVVRNDRGVQAGRGWLSCLLPSMAQVARPPAPHPCSDR